MTQTALASFDVTRLSPILPDVTQEFGLSGGSAGTLGSVVYGAEFLPAVFAGHGMDRGRRWVWMSCLTMAALPSRHRLRPGDLHVPASEDHPGRDLEALSS